MFISVRTVESHVSTLLRKLGAQDRPALIQLAQQLPGELLPPTSATSFVGREAELALLSGMLVTSPLVTVVGPAGCGKTRLALEAAHRWPGAARMADLSAMAGAWMLALGRGQARLSSRAAPRDGAVLPARELARWWARGLVDPAAVMRALPGAAWPKAGLVAVVTRFTVQDLVQAPPLALLGRRPFIPAKLPIRPEHHYRAQLAFLPVFGMGQWLLMGATAHGLLRLAGERPDLSRVLDVIGVGMLIPMPPLWLCDVALIAADRFRLPELAIVNPTVQLWETALFCIGLRTALGVSWWRAIPAGLAASVVYVLGASRFLR